MSWQQGPPGGGPPPPGSPPPPPSYPPPGYGQGPPEPGYNGLAIASLVVGATTFLWTYGVGAIVALIFGLLAKRQIRERGEKGGAMATAGVVLGIIGIVGAAVLVALLVIFGDEANDDDFFEQSLRPPAVVWVSPDPAVAPPRVVAVPAPG